MVCQEMAGIELSGNAGRLNGPNFEPVEGQMPYKGNKTHQP
jgi:hypothetical protein